MNLAKTVSKNVKVIRLASGMSQQQLANKSGLSVRYISRLENAAQNVTLDILERLSVGLGREVIELVSLDKTPNLPRYNAQIIDKMIGLLKSIRIQLKD